MKTNLKRIETVWFKDSSQSQFQIEKNFSDKTTNFISFNFLGSNFHIAAWKSKWMKKLETVNLKICHKMKISLKIMSKDDSTNFKSFNFLRPNFNISA